MRFEGRAANTLNCVGGALGIGSHGSVSLHHIRPPANHARGSRLAWEWRVTRSGGVSDLSERGGDDRNLAVLVAFRYDPEAASFKERLLRPLIEAREGEDAPGRVLAYTWAGGTGAGGQAAGEASSGPPMRRMIESPFGGAAHRILVLRRGPGPWAREEIDLARDYRAAFGAGGYEIQHIAIAADTDDLGGEVEAQIRNLVLR